MCNVMTQHKRRTKGSGTLIRRGDRWAMRWRDGEGHIVQELTPYRVAVKADRARALALLDERTEVLRLRSRSAQLAALIAERESAEARLRRLMAQAATTSRGETLADLERLWRESPRRRDCRELQLERYAQQVRAFVAWAGPEVDLRAVDDAMAERYAAALAARLSGNTYNKHLTTLSAVWRAVGKTRGLGNPWEDLPRRRLDTHVRRALTSEEIANIIAAADGELRALVRIGARTGLRLGDACRLTWGAFRADGTLVVRTRKTGAEVMIPAARLRDELSADAPGAHAPDELITPHIAERHGRDPGGVCAAIRRLFRRAGIEPQVSGGEGRRARPDASFHSLRHTFITRAIEAGVPAPIVRALVGHATAAMTDHYTHVGAAVIAEAFEKAGL